MKVLEGQRGDRMECGSVAEVHLRYYSVLFFHSGSVLVL